jgi:hypothetical protein
MRGRKSTTVATNDALASIAATALGAATTFWVIVAAHEAAE